MTKSTLLSATYKVEFPFFNNAPKVCTQSIREVHRNENLFIKFKLNIVQY